MKKLFPLFVALLSCAPKKPPEKWETGGRMLAEINAVRQVSVEAYYIARIESPARAYDTLETAIEGARAVLTTLAPDTAGLVPQERVAYGRAIVMLGSYLDSLSDTGQVFRRVRLTGEAPFAGGLEEASAILAILSLQHGSLEAAEGALGRKFTPQEKLSLKSAYATVMLGDQGPGLNLWPNPDTVKPSEGLVLEIWALNDSIASFFPVAETRGDSFITPRLKPMGEFYIYGPGLATEAVVMEEVVSTRKPLDPNATYMGLPARVFWREDYDPTPLSPDSALEVFTRYVEGTKQDFDSVVVSRTQSFWVRPGRDGHIVFVNAFRGKRLFMFTLVVENGEVLHAECLRADQGYLGIEVVGALDLNYDRISELVLSIESEDSRIYRVLVRRGGVWWDVLENEIGPDLAEE